MRAMDRVDSEAGRRDALRERLVVAVERGEVRGDADPDCLIEIIGGSAMLHVLMRPGGNADGAMFDENWADRLAALVLHGVMRCERPASRGGRSADIDSQDELPRPPHHR